MNFLFFSFLSIHRAQQQQSRSGWHQMYLGDSVVGKASTIGIEIPHPSPNFHRRSKSAKFGVVFNIPILSIPNVETNLCRNDRPMPLPSLVKVTPRTPENHFNAASPKIAWRNVLNRQ